MILIFLTVTGACAGSTAGGLKITRLNILVKSVFKKIKNMISPRKVDVIKIDGKPMSDESVNAVEGYLVVYVAILFLGAFLISFDGYDFATNLTASLTCVSNVGPGYTDLVGPYGSFAILSDWSKFILALEMIIGRLEFFPILVLFNPKTWNCDAQYQEPTTNTATIENGYQFLDTLIITCTHDGKPEEVGQFSVYLETRNCECTYSE
jgi:trk system potassium uptake protein TrkH